MGFMEKLKLLFRERQPATDLINEIKTAKAGWKTLPFWLSVFGTLGAISLGLHGIIPLPTELMLTTAFACFYNILRGATKSNVVGTKPITQTSEFWFGVGSQLLIAIASLKQGGIDTAWLATAGSFVGAAMAAGQSLAGQQPNAPVIAPEK